MNKECKPLFQLDNVSKVFEQKRTAWGPSQKVGAVVDVSLDIYPSEIIALVGESGCGKTTLAKLVTGLEAQTSGHIYYNGIDTQKMNRHQKNAFRSDVQMVQQDSYAALNPARTILQSLSSPLIQKKVVKNRKDAYKRVFELLKTVELTPPELFLKKYPHQLSGGQRQRILMARAISLNPKLIVADEPVSMIDVSLRIAILNLMSMLNKKLGIAFIYITHDLATARYIAKNGRIAVMYLGKIVELGDMAEVLSNPRHPYLQALLSAVPIPNPHIAKSKQNIPLKNLDMPNIADLPSGCRFNPRCPYATDICTKEEPMLVDIEGIKVACHRVDEIPVWEFPGLSDSTRKEKM